MKSKIQPHSIQIILADDDFDDQIFFTKALNELAIDHHLKVFQDGEVLMKYLLLPATKLPDMLFLDLSMPRKTGIECLTEIKENERLKNIPIIMFSTSYMRDSIYEQNLINMLYDLGAQDFVRKQGNFEHLKKVIRASIDKILAIES